MKKQVLLLSRAQNGNFHSVFKTNHSRLVYIEIKFSNDGGRIANCYYVDRFKAGEYYSVPKALKTTTFTADKLLSVIEEELDRKFYDISLDYRLGGKSPAEFIKIRLSEIRNKYSFLIFVGEGETIDGIPAIIRTRFKNQAHRSIYLEIVYDADGRGVIRDCHYYDRKYKVKKQVVPETLYTVVLEYNRQAILNIVNKELNAAFTDVLFVTDGSIDIERETAICGNI